MVQIASAEHASVHRAEHLNVIKWVEPEPPGDAIGTISMSFLTPSSGSADINDVEVTVLSLLCVSGMWPLLIRWALTTMRLSAACRNTSVSRTTGTRPELMMSASTCPGPTDGNWSTSPTSSRPALEAPPSVAHS